MYFLPCILDYFFLNHFWAEISALYTCIVSRPGVVSVVCSVLRHLLINLWYQPNSWHGVQFVFAVFGKLLSFYFCSTLVLSICLFTTQYFIPFLSCIVPLCMSTALSKRFLLLSAHYSTWVFSWCTRWLLASHALVLALCCCSFGKYFWVQSNICYPKFPSGY